MTFKITSEHLAILRTVRQCEDWNILMSVPMKDPKYVQQLFDIGFLEIRNYLCENCSKEHEGFFVTKAGREVEARIYGTNSKTQH